MTLPLQKTLLTAVCLTVFALPAISQTVSPGFDAFDAGAAPTSFAFPSPAVSVPSSVTAPASPSLSPSSPQVAPTSNGNVAQDSDTVSVVPTVPVSGNGSPDRVSSSMPEPGSLLSGRPAFTGGSFFFLDGVPIRLSGVAFPPVGEVCRTNSGTEWLCGRSSSSRLSMLFEGKTSSCRVVKSFTGGVSAVCSSGTVLDVGRIMISEGWAVPVGIEGRQYSSESLSARASGSGLWSGSFRHHSNW